jgi:hypothetical protein
MAPVPDRPATERPAQPARPADRYGDDRGAGRRVLLRALLAVLAVGGTALVVWIGLHQADRPVRADVVGFDQVTDDSLRVRVRVVKDDGSEVTCRVVARDEDAVVVGAEELRLGPADGAGGTVLLVVPTSARPVTAEVADCRTG